MKKRASEKRATCKGVSQMLAEEGFKGVNLYHGEGYYYFSGGIASQFSEQSLGDFHIGTYKMIWNDFIYKLKENQDWIQISSDIREEEKALAKSLISEGN